MNKSLEILLVVSTALVTSACSHRPPGLSPAEMEAQMEQREQKIRQGGQWHADADDDATPIRHLIHVPSLDSAHE